MSVADEVHMDMADFFGIAMGNVGAACVKSGHQEESRLGMSGVTGQDRAGGGSPSRRLTT